MSTGDGVTIIRCRRKLLSEADQKRILQALQDGVTATHCAERFGCSKDTIRVIKNRSGLFAAGETTQRVGTGTYEGLTKPIPRTWKSGLPKQIPCEASALHKGRCEGIATRLREERPVCPNHARAKNIKWYQP